MPKIQVVTERCKSCGYCVKYCPQKIIVIGSEVNSKGYEYIVTQNAEKCTGCCICARMCPDGAIEVYK